MVRSLDMHGHWINSIALSSDHVMRNSPPTESEAKLSPAQRFAKATGGVEERMVSCSDDHTLCLWLPCSSKKPVARMTGHMQPVNHVAFSPDGSMIASASFDKSVKIWDGRTGKSRCCIFAFIGSFQLILTISLFYHDSHFLPNRTALTLSFPKANFSAVALVMSAQFIRSRGRVTAACLFLHQKTALSKCGMQKRAS
jgi:WD40 repeat protein